MKSIRFFAPNFLTSLNLLSGALAVVLLFEGFILVPVYLLLLAAAFDFLDGFVAKSLKAVSEFGKQMDSLADLVSFGFAPSVLFYKGIVLTGHFQALGKGLENLSVSNWLISAVPFLFLVFAALRLARFNTQESVGNDFSGLPVPAATLFVVSFWLVVNSDDVPELRSALLQPYILIGIILLLSFLMVSKIPMLSLKFEGIGFKMNIWRYLLITGTVVFFAIFTIKGLLFIMLFYLLLSLIKSVAGISRSKP